MTDARIERVARKICADGGFDPETPVLDPIGGAHESGPKGSVVVNPHNLRRAWEMFSSEAASAIASLDAMMKDPQA